ncbi:MAG: amidophosphoribosyltransferase, partial [Erythrobacter sp.]
TPERSKLLAARMELEPMREFIKADSLAFISIDGLYRAVGKEGRDPACPQFCDACFTGDYPTRLTDLAQQERRDGELPFADHAGKDNRAA